MRVCVCVLVCVLVLVCVCVPSSVKQHLMLLLFCNHLAEEEIAGCFTLIVFLLLCGC